MLEEPSVQPRAATARAPGPPVGTGVDWGPADLTVRVLYAFTTTGPATTITVRGQLDQAGAPVLRGAWDTGLESFRGTVHLELDDVVFCNGAGLAVLAAITESCRARGTVLELSARGQTARLVRLTGLTDPTTDPAGPPAVPPRPRTSPEGRATAADRVDARRWADPVAHGHERDVVAALLAAAGRVVDGVDSVSVALGDDRRRLWSAGSAGPVGDRLAEAEAQTGEGPGVQSRRDAVDVHVEDLHCPDSAVRWPRLVPALASVPARSVMCLDLALPGRPVGTLTLTSARPRAFDAQARDQAETLAVVAALTLVAERDRRQLTAALAHRDVIGQAKGILMERHRITATAAFDLLQAASNRTNTKLHQVAAGLAETGAL